MLVLLLAAQYVPAGENVFWTVGGVAREARVVAPSAVTPHPPVVFCFHGGGGQAYYAIDEYAIHKNWPEALVYYAQGLIGSGGFSTWSPRDTAFFDAMRADAIHHRSGDPKRVFVMGYSTGANFCGDLWRSRGSEITGFAFVSGGRYNRAWPSRPAYLNYAIAEPDASRLRSLGDILLANAAKTGTSVKVTPRTGGHTYPQSADVELAMFLKACPPLP